MKPEIISHERCIVIRRGSIQLLGVTPTDEEMRVLQAIAQRVPIEPIWLPTREEIES
ncbi:hypothetical protein [Burkholderia thailandensis]|uniref:hypothetical protein n=1 Tax=Burkholderia thailandensis TaxID=57975 RepID=UPI00186400BA|nr:hypothetical protein [Burkholderia thailandensis]